MASPCPCLELQRCTFSLAMNVAHHLTRKGKKKIWVLIFKEVPYNPSLYHFQICLFFYFFFLFLNLKQMVNSFQSKLESTLFWIPSNRLLSRTSCSSLVLLNSPFYRFVSILWRSELLFLTTRRLKHLEPWSTLDFCRELEKGCSESNVRFRFFGLGFVYVSLVLATANFVGDVRRSLWFLSST